MAWFSKNITDSVGLHSQIPLATGSPPETGWTCPQSIPVWDYFLSNTREETTGYRISWKLFNFRNISHGYLFSEYIYFLVFLKVFVFFLKSVFCSKAGLTHIILQCMSLKYPLREMISLSSQSVMPISLQTPVPAGRLTSSSPSGRGLPHTPQKEPSFYRHWTLKTLCSLQKSSLFIICDNACLKE